MNAYRYIKTEYLDMVSGGDKGVISELVALFSDQVVEFHKQMEEYLEEHSYKKLRMIAHKAKSSVAIVGMEALSEKLKRLELKSDEGNAREAREIVDYFGTETTEAIEELKRYIDSL